MIQDIAPHKLYNQFVTEQKVRQDSQVFCFKGRNLLIRTGEDNICLPVKEEMDRAGTPAEAVYSYLFKLDQTEYFILLDEDLAAVPEGYEYVNIRTMRIQGMGPRELIFAVNTAAQLACWYRDNRFCGTCGHRTILSRQERAVQCPECGRLIYPRIIPAVIVGVTNGDEIVMTKYAGRGMHFYALIAGFTEIGEAFEDTVRREVMEEVGLKVKNIRYYKSQPWGVVDDILAGYYCDVDGDTQIRMDRTELKEAVWVKREDVTLQPDDFSLTNEMMMAFRDGKEPK